MNRGMTPEEATEILEEIKELDDTLYAYSADYMEALEVALSVLKEIQNYRKLGTLEELARAKKYIDLAKKHGTIGEMIDECAEYEAIGTVEECWEVMEKLTKAEKAFNAILSGNYNDECNFCVHNNNPMANCQCISGDGSWCTHNAKWNSKISDIDSLEAIDDGTRK